MPENNMQRYETFNRVVDSLKQAKNNKTDLESFASDVYNNAGVNGQSIKAVVDYSAGQSGEWRRRFNEAFNKEYYGKPSDFELVRSLNSEEKEAIQETFAVTTGGEGGTADFGGMIQTNINAAIDGLFQRDSILSKVQVIRDTNSYQLPEFGAEETADRIAENAAGSEKDDFVPRDGDTLTITNTTNKIKVFEKISDLTLRAVRPEDYGIVQARLARKMNRKFESEILLGTNASGQFSGLINTNTGAGAFGALASTLPLSGVAGGVQDDVDAVKYLISDLPSEVSDSDLARYTLVMNRPTKWRVKRERDANGRTFDLNMEFENINMFESFAMTDDRVLLTDLSLYYVLLAKPIDIEVEKEPNTEMYFIKSFTYADGGVRMGYKTLADGATANTAKNAHRYADLKADYSA
jgi:hypothetical protein